MTERTRLFDGCSLLVNPGVRVCGKQLPAAGWRRNDRNARCFRFEHHVDDQQTSQALDERTQKYMVGSPLARAEARSPGQIGWRFLHPPIILALLILEEYGNAVLEEHT